jgi:predicted SnoaL-like aldol condensation-catalyzing enzyme
MRALAKPRRCSMFVAAILFGLCLASSSEGNAHPPSAGASGFCPHGKLQLERNKQTVIAFYNTSFNEGQAQLALEKYVGEDARGDKLYIQHNPQAADGAQGFIDFVTGFKAAFPAAHVEIVRMVAECDLVVTHSYFTLFPGDRGSVGADIFRLDRKGKIVEHWDVIQAIPETSANDNGMI